MSTIADPKAPRAPRARPSRLTTRGNTELYGWVFMRASGVILLVHVLDTALVRVSPEAYNSVIGTYKNPIVGLGEAGLVAAVVFHALNGVRVMLVDFWHRGTRLQRQMLWVVVGLWVILMVPFLVRHLGNVLGA